MTEVIIDAGTLEFSDADLTATGLLIPYGVKCRSNLGEFTVDTGVFETPTDLTGMSLNVEHKREDVVGAFSKVWEQPEGMLATFQYADTAEGRQAYEDGKSGKKKNLSAEIAKVRIQDGKAISGRLFAASQVSKPAFEGATLLAAENTPEEQQDRITAVLAALERATQGFEEANRLARATPVAEAVNPSSGAPDEVIKNEEIVVTDTLEAGAIVPATLLASASGVALKSEEVDLGSVFASIHAVKNGGGAGTADAETLLAALSDIKVEAAGGLTTANSGVIQPAWVGKVWQGRSYERKYMDLLNHQYGGISLAGRKGFKLDQGTALVTEWSGNKTEMGSGSGTTSVISSSRKAYGWAADIAREWFDLEGGAEVIEGLLRGVVDSYAKVTDLAALATIFNVASKSSAALDRLIAPQTYPTQYPAAMGQLIQAIEAVSDADDDASFAIVNPTAWTKLLFTPKDLVPEFIEFGVGLGTGEATAGKVRVVKAPQSYFTGTTAANPQVIAGAKSAIEFREQGSTPIQIDALDIAKGGVDKAVLGYLETFVVRPESVVLVGTKP